MMGCLSPSTGSLHKWIPRSSLMTALLDSPKECRPITPCSKFSKTSKKKCGFVIHFRASLSTFQAVVGTRARSSGRRVDLSKEMSSWAASRLSCTLHRTTVCSTPALETAKHTRTPSLLSMTKDIGLLDLSLLKTSRSVRTLSWGNTSQLTITNQARRHLPPSTIVYPLASCRKGSVQLAKVTLHWKLNCDTTWLFSSKLSLLLKNIQNWFK